MKISPTIWKQTGHIAIGVLIGDAIMLAVFYFLHKLDLTVLFGAALGSVGAVANFFVMGLMLQKALRDPDRTKAVVQRSYLLRMLAMAAIMILGVVLPCFHVVAVVVPFLLPSITIRVMRLLGLYKPEQEGGQNA